MRVTSNTLQSVFLASLQAAQQRLAATQTQVTTGQRVNTPSDDPVAAARIVQLEASLARFDQYRANGVLATSRLGLEEQALGGAIDNLQRVRELAIQANNDSLSSSDRRAIAAELRERKESLLALANSTDADGRYLFAGYSENTQPFTKGAGGTAVYNGDQGQRSVQISDTRFVAVSDSGAEIFQRVPNGNGTFTLTADALNSGTGVLGAGTVVNSAAWTPGTYTISFLTPATYEVRDGATLVTAGNFEPGQSIAFLGIDVPLQGQPATGDTFTVAASTSRDIFATLDALIATVESPTVDAASRARLHSGMGQLLLDLEQATDHVIDARSAIGPRVLAVEQEAALSEEVDLQLMRTLTDLNSVDYAEALSRLSQQLFGLEAAQKAYAQTQSLSLFNYL